MSFRRCSLVLALLPFAACASYRDFAPKEQRNGRADRGQPVAVYALGDKVGHRGQLRVWSDGAKVATVDGHDRTQLRLVLELTSFGDLGLALDAAALRIVDFTADVAMPAELAPASVQGETAVKPGGTSRIDCTFEPGEVLPRGIDGFTLRWRVLASPGDVMWEQATPFEPWFPADEWGPYPHWGWGFGFGWGWRWRC